MASEILIDTDDGESECDFCFAHHSNADLCCVTDIEDMPYNCPRKKDLSGSFFDCSD
jgi:hypothetical protein